MNFTLAHIIQANLFTIQRTISSISSTQIWNPIIQNIIDTNFSWLCWILAIAGTKGVDAVIEAADQ